MCAEIVSHFGAFGRYVGAVGAEGFHVYVLIHGFVFVGNQFVTGMRRIHRYDQCERLFILFLCLDVFDGFIRFISRAPLVDVVKTVTWGSRCPNTSVSDDNRMSRRLSSIQIRDGVRADTIRSTLLCRDCCKCLHKVCKENPDAIFLCIPYGSSCLFVHHSNSGPPVEAPLRKARVCELQLPVTLLCRGYMPVISMARAGDETG